MRLADYFDRIYILYLPQRADRVQHMESQVAKLGMENHAVWFPGLRFSEPAGFPSAGVRGCVMSHYTMLNQAAADGVERLLIVQDDCTFSSHLVRNQEDFAQQLSQSDWDFAYLGHNSNLNQRKKGSIPKDFVPVAPEQRVMFTHCCAYRGRVIPRLTGLIADSLTRSPGDPRGGPMYFDGYMNTFRANEPDVVTLLAAPSQAWQFSSSSDLTPSRLDRYKPLAPIIRLARLAKRAVHAVS